MIFNQPPPDDADDSDTDSGVLAQLAARLKSQGLPQQMIDAMLREADQNLLEPAATGPMANPAMPMPDLQGMARAKALRGMK